jgi:hypothetical protein
MVNGWAVVQFVAIGQIRKVGQFGQWSWPWPWPCPLGQTLHINRRKLTKVLKGQTATPAPIPGQVLPIETVVNQTPDYVTTVYVGNLPPTLTQEEIAPIFGQFGIVQEIKLQAERGFAFVK